jgi:hypothetical protein
MFQFMKRWGDRAGLDWDKMTVVTRVAGYVIVLSISIWGAAIWLWAPSFGENWFRGEFGNAALWLPYVILYFAVSLQHGGGRANLGFVVALASAPVQLALGFYKDWETIFTLDPFLFLEDAQWSFQTDFGFWLYISNALHLIGIVLLIAGRKEWRAKSTR